MRLSPGTVPFLGALGIGILFGCADSQGPMTKAPQAQNKSGKPAALARAEAGPEYVITVEGMT
jgi:hypothetical protein